MNEHRPDLTNETLAQIRDRMKSGIANDPRLRPQARPLPPAFRHVIKVDWFRKFTFWERIHILLGCNLLVLVRIPTLHKPGETHPILAAEVADAAQPSDVMDRGVKAELASIMPKGYNIEVEQ